MFHEAVKLGSWDDQVSAELACRWFEWIESLKCLVSFKIPRCIKPKQFNDAAIELHVFSDDNEQAYGSCYLRCVFFVSNNQQLINSLSWDDHHAIF